MSTRLTLAHPKPGLSINRAAIAPPTMTNLATFQWKSTPLRWWPDFPNDLKALKNPHPLAVPRPFPIRARPGARSKERAKGEPSLGDKVDA